MDNQSLHLLAQNIQKIRAERGLTLTGLAQRSGVAKSTLSLLERGQGNPTIETVWAVANALEVPFGDIIEGLDATRNSLEKDHAPGVRVRFTERYGANPRMEIYEMTIDGGHNHLSNAHPSGVFERVIALHGDMLVGSAENSVMLHPGQSYSFEGDKAHVYAALKDKATALVLMEYRGDSAQSGGYGIVLDYPQSDAEWEGVRALTNRAAIDVAQGLTSFFLELRGRDIDIHEVESHLDMIHSSGFRWPLFVFVGKNENSAWIAIIPQHFVCAFAVKRDRLDDYMPAIMAPASQLAAMAEQLPGPLDSSLMKQLEALRSSLVLESLASEVALQHGLLLLPDPLRSLSPGRKISDISGVSDEDFSNRINVDLYDAYKLLHPAYARQVLALAQDVLAFDQRRGRGLFMDIGSGPGTALLMLMELLPESHALALESDDKAFSSLLKNTENLMRLRCEPVDFLAFHKLDEALSVITSIGSSHHFNTAFMLQKAWHLLADNGVLCIADELLPEFTDLDSRNNALIRHHVTYILSSMANVDRLDVESTDSADLTIYYHIREQLVRVFMLAQNNQTGSAVKCCRDLFEHIHQNIAIKFPSSALGAFVRFYILEIEVMVAGFDYEIEHKTYPKRLAALAYGAGFELLSHRRVFASSGTDEWDGGTHVFAFRKRTRAVYEAP
ncbi:helix-turn-helix domain-containing protein [Acidithiobacillus sp. M4-SHS-6]|uniref:helix-turn-helix domain-containing protein n=1 Tax=Acidithiobacillus sp. M4-SHS-6 TaxID=3383024 RepID=UPI0039BE5D30